jgi:hypothetical protein
MRAVINYKHNSHGCQWENLPRAGSVVWVCFLEESVIISINYDDCRNTEQNQWLRLAQKPSHRHYPASRCSRHRRHCSYHSCSALIGQDVWPIRAKPQGAWCRCTGGFKKRVMWRDLTFSTSSSPSKEGWRQNHQLALQNWRSITISDCKTEGRSSSCRPTRAYCTGKIMLLLQQIIYC